MPYNGSIIYGAVGIHDVQQALGDASNDEGTLCTSEAINPWAKYKPIRVAGKYEEITDDERKDANYGFANIPAWTGSSANIGHMGNFWFGIEPNYTNRPACGIQSIYWEYQKPYGDAYTPKTPYRISDFSANSGTYGYKGDVDPPVGPCASASLEITPHGYLEITFEGQGISQGDGYAVPISELTVPGLGKDVFGSLYFSVMIHKTGSSIFYVASRDYVWSADQSTSVTKLVTKTIGLALVGECEVFPFLSANPYSSFISTPSDGSNCIAMYEKSTVNLSIRYASIRIRSAYGYRYIASSAGQSNKYVYVVADIENTDIDAVSYNATVTLYSSKQVVVTPSSGGYLNGTLSGNETTTIVFQLYVAEYFSSLKNGYFTIDFDFAGTSQPIFKKSEGWAMTLLTDGSEEPEITRL